MLTDNDGAFQTPINMQASFSTGAVVPFRESLKSLIGKKRGVPSGDGEGDKARRRVYSKPADHQYCPFQSTDRLLV